MRSNERWLHLDIFKFIGLSSLLLWHTIDWWYSDGKGFILPQNQDPTLYTDFFQIGMSFFLFVCISLPIGAGISLRFMLNKFYDKDKNKIINKEAVFFILKRGFLLIFFGMIINISSFGIDEFLSWDILQMVGLVSIFITLSLFLIPLKFLTIFSILLLLLSKLITNIYHEALGGYSSYSIKLFSNIFFGDPSGQSYYAFFPWAFFVVIGFYLANLYLNKKKEKINKILIINGIFLFPFFVFYRNIWQYDINNTWGSHIFMPETFDLLGVISIFSLFFFLVNKIDLNKYKYIFSIKSLNPINIFARNIMYIYVIHSIVVSRVINLFIDDYRYNTVLTLTVFILQYLFAYLVGIIVHLYRHKERLNVDI